jgi:phosphate starvation-inducible membrane PsiE
MDHRVTRLRRGPVMTEKKSGGSQRSAIRATRGASPMSRAVRAVCTATNAIHRDMKEAADALGKFLVEAFHLLALFAIGATTVWSAVAAFLGMVAAGQAGLADILLLFIYLEIGAMVGIYFKTTRLPVRYLIYIAVTALGRVLIEIVGADFAVVLCRAGAALRLVQISVGPAGGRLEFGQREEVRRVEPGNRQSVIPVKKPETREIDHAYSVVRGNPRASVWRRLRHLQGHRRLT